MSEEETDREKERQSERTRFTEECTNLKRSTNKLQKLFGPGELNLIGHPLRIDEHHERWAGLLVVVHGKPVESQKGVKRRLYSWNWN